MGEIFFVVPFGRDGAADRAARAFGERFPPRRRPGPHLLLENLPGAGGKRGVERANVLALANQPVLLLGTPSTHILLPARLGAKTAPSAAFKPLVGLGSAPNVLLVSPRLGVRSVGDLIAKARAEALTYASAGTGQTIHVCTALFCRQAGIEMEHRPYEGGSATAYDDLTSGRVHVYFDNLLACRERIAGGDVVALAVSSTQRSDLLPGVPTLVERGFPDHALDVWLGVFAANVDDEFARLAAAAALIPTARFRREIEASSARWRHALEAAGMA